MLEPFVLGERFVRGAIRCAFARATHECPRRTHPALVEAMDRWGEVAWVALDHSAT